MAKLKTLPRMLYWITKPSPTVAERDDAHSMSLEYDVVFRNANYVPNDGGSLEQFDALAGEVPEVYAQALADRVAEKEALDAERAAEGKPPAGWVPKVDQVAEGSPLAAAGGPVAAPAPRTSRGIVPGTGWSPNA